MKHKDKEWLFEEFVSKNRSAPDIGKECGVTAVTVRWWARHFEFRRRRWGSKNLNDRYFSKIDNEQKAYWLGFIAADGSVQNKTGMRKLAIELSMKDRGHIECFRDHIQSDHKIYEVYRKKSYEGWDFETHSVRLDLPSAILVEDLGKQGIMPRKTFKLQPPSVRKNLIRHWIRGYFDGDGCIYSRGKNRCFNVIGRKVVVSYIRDHIPMNGPIYAQKNIWRFDVYCSGGNIKKLYRYLYDEMTICLDRKRAKFGV